MNTEKTSLENENQPSCLGAVSSSFYQDEFTRRPNGLLYKMRILFDKHELTTWEFQEFRKMVRSFCKEYDLHFDENKEMVYKRGEQNCH
jgi:hypothetical protein